MPLKVRREMYEPILRHGITEPFSNYGSPACGRFEVWTPSTHNHLVGRCAFQMCRRPKVSRRIAYAENDQIRLVFFGGFENPVVGFPYRTVALARASKRAIGGRMGLQADSVRPRLPAICQLG